MIQRRAVLFMLGLPGIGVALAVQAQQSTKPLRVGVLASSSPESDGYLFDALKGRLGELGYAEGKDVVYDFRWAGGRAERFPQLAQELVALKPDVILVTGGPIAEFAAQQATRSIPIVDTGMSDPVDSGLDIGPARPGGNVTELSDLTDDASPKRLQYLLEVVPKGSRVVVLGSTADPQPALLKVLQVAGQTVGVDVRTMEVASPAEIEAAFARMAQEHIGGLVPIGTALTAHMREIADLALTYRLPAIFGFRAAAEAGGLMSYGTDTTETFRRGAEYVDRIFRGVNPADPPIEQATKLEFVINLKTARALGITIPQPMLLRADELIN